MIFYFYALHVLTADVEYAVHIGVEECRRRVVSYRLDLALIKHECRLYKRLAVSGRTRICYSRRFWHFRIYILYRLYGCRERASVIIAVKRIQKRTILCHNGSLCRRGTRIYSKIAVTLICRKISCRNLVLALSFKEAFVILLSFKQRLHSLDLKFHFYAVLKKLLHAGKRSALAILRTHGCADSCKQMRIFGHYRMLFIKLKRSCKCRSKLRKKMQRSS